MSNWEEMYQEGDTHWDKGEASPCLIDWLQQNSGKYHGRVLVPGCGFGHDARAWAVAGLDVVGMDVAPTAIEGARKLSPTDQGKITFQLGDFFAPPKDLKPFDIVFEHTFFCAIQPDQREDYVSNLLKWLKPGGHYLAINYFLPKDEDGPPFGTDREEVLERFSPHFTLLEDWVPRSWEHRVGKERMFLWKR